jgi:hypothetical protein
MKILIYFEVKINRYQRSHLIPIYIGTDSLHIKRNRAQLVPPYSGSPLFKESALNKKFLTGMGCAKMALSERRGSG